MVTAARSLDAYIMSYIALNGRTWFHFQDFFIYVGPLYNNSWQSDSCIRQEIVDLDRQSAAVSDIWAVDRKLFDAKDDILLFSLQGLRK